MRPFAGRPETLKPPDQSRSARTAVVVEFGDQMKSLPKFALAAVANGFVVAAVGVVPLTKAEAPCNVVVMDAPEAEPVTVPRTSK